MYARAQVISPGQALAGERAARESGNSAPAGGSCGRPAACPGSWLNAYAPHDPELSSTQRNRPSCSAPQRTSWNITAWCSPFVFSRRFIISIGIALP